MKRKSLRAQSQKLEEQVLPKSINYSAAKYPSLPGVEGAQTHPRVTPARGTPPERSCRIGRKRHSSLSPLKPDISNIPQAPRPDPHTTPRAAPHPESQAAGKNKNANGTIAFDIYVIGIEEVIRICRGIGLEIF